MAKKRSKTTDIDNNLSDNIEKDNNTSAYKSLIYKYKTLKYKRNLRLL